MSVEKYNDEYWMQQAIKQARLAEGLDEVPVGCVIVKNNKIIGSGFNRVISNNDASAHAEIQALRDAGDKCSNYRLPDTILYVTLEPCMMCVGAMVHARIKKVVFAAFDPKTGMAGTKDDCFHKPYHNHQVEIQGGILESECAKLLQDFFKRKRQFKA